MDIFDPKKHIVCITYYPQGVALGYALLPFQGVTYHLYTHSL